MSAIRSSSEQASVPEGRKQVPHTPGPWAVKGANLDCEIEIEGDGQTVCVVLPCSDDEILPWADASLIAASPRMYDYIAARAEGGDLDARDILEAINASR